MSNETIKEIIDGLNNGKCKYEYYSRRISDNVEFTKMFIYEPPSPELRLRDDRFFDMYFIFNDNGKYVGAVLDMTHDLHWYILPEERKKGYLASNLKKTILPHLSQSREVQEISIDIYDDEIDSKNSERAALLAGFSKIGTDKRSRLLYEKNLVELSWNTLAESDSSLSKSRMESLQKKIQYVSELMTRISIEVEMKYGESDFVEDMEYHIKEMEEKIPELEDLWYKKNTVKA